MPDEDPIPRYIAAGLALLALTQQKAEAVLKDVSSSGETAVVRAQKAAEWLAERGRKGTDELLEVVRREIRDQIRALNLATKDDIARLEARLAGTNGPTGTAGTGSTGTADKPGPTGGAGPVEA